MSADPSNELECEHDGFWQLLSLHVCSKSGGHAIATSLRNILYACSYPTDIATIGTADGSYSLQCITVIGIDGIIPMLLRIADGIAYSASLHVCMQS